MISEKDLIYLNKYSNVSNDVKNKINKHMKKYSLNTICAYYVDWDDFCSDWCTNLNYTKKEARKLLHGGIGEFQIIKDFGIIRYVI